MSRYTTFEMTHDAEDHDLVLVWGILTPDDGALNLDFASEEAAAAVAVVLGKVFQEGYDSGISRACDAIVNFANRLRRGDE